MTSDEAPREVGNYPASKYILEPVIVTDGGLDLGEPYVICRATLTVGGQARTIVTGDWLSVERIEHDDGCWEWGIWLCCAAADLLTQLGLPAELTEYVAETVTDGLVHGPVVSVPLDHGAITVALVDVREDDGTRSP